MEEIETVFLKYYDIINGPALMGLEPSIIGDWMKWRSTKRRTIVLTASVLCGAVCRSSRMMVITRPESETGLLATSDPIS